MYYLDALVADDINRNKINSDLNSIEDHERIVKICINSNLINQFATERGKKIRTTTKTGGSHFMGV